MSYTRLEIAKHAEKIGRSGRTLRRWVLKDCNLDDPVSVEKFLAEAERKKTNVRRYQEARGVASVRPKSERRRTVPTPSGFESVGNGETLGPPGKRGAAAALSRLEQQEEESHRRLQLALDASDLLQVDAIQGYWLRCAESLRKLDLSVEINRRSGEEQISRKKAEQAISFVAETFKASFMQFLDVGAAGILGIKEIGDLKIFVIERFKPILDHVVKTNSAGLPSWAKRSPQKRQFHRAGS